MIRTIQPAPALVEVAPVDGVVSDLPGWLAEAGRAYGLRWLLAHADDGVIWGQCLFSDDAAPRLALQPAPPALRPETLQMARLFGPDAELLLWRDSDGAWHARLLRDVAGDEKPIFQESFDEEQILWGDHGRVSGESNGVAFVEMSDGAQGLRHTVPLADAAGDYAERPLRLRVRHYVAEDGDDSPSPGFARVVASRLCELKAVKGAAR